jgi:cell wall-associated NlpC family hydrolase
MVAAHMRRAALLLSAILAVVVPVVPAAADSIQDKQREASRLASRIEQLQATAEQLAEDYNEAVDALADVDRDVTAARARLTQQEAELATLRSRMSEFALKSYVFADQAAGVASLLDDMVLSGQASGRSGYAAVAMGANLDLTDQLTATVDDTTALRTSLEAKLERQRALTESVAGKRKDVDRAGAEAEAALSDVKGDLAQLVAEERQRRLEDEARQQQEEVRRQQERASVSRSAAVGAPRRSGSVRSSGGGGGASAPRPSSPARPRVGANVPSPSPGAAGAVRAAMSQVGVAYRYASSAPGVAFDCSGLTSWAWGQAGVSLPRNSRAQYAALPRVPIEQIQPGDLVFSGSPIHHVGIYVGGGQIVHASMPGVGVVVSPMRRVVGVARPGG